ncbi:ABC transporter permease subunit [Bradyrhizobium sp. RT9a]|uniref:ABC transporter permease subunit n=1 Tax=Bradyrhizobium sp. RT9a TaxID=3156384 RepID=UPI003397B543
MRNFRKVAGMPLMLSVPAFAILLVVFGIPLVQLLFTSFNAPNFSLAHYRAFVAESANVRILLQTVELSVVATTLCLAIGYPTAYLIAAASKGVRTALIVLVFIPWLTSGLVRTYAWVAILGDRGIVNTLLIDWKLITSPLPLVYNRFAVYIGMVHIMLPTMILPLVSSMMGVDRSLIAAARSMGATPWAAFWRVFFPLTVPGVRSGVLLVFVICLGFYITPAALGGLRDTMLSNLIAAQLANSVELAPVAAIAFLLLGVAVVALLLFGIDVSGTPGASQRRAGWRTRLQLAVMQGVVFGKLTEAYRARRWKAQLFQPGRAVRWVERASGFFFVALVMIYLQLPGLVVVAMSFSPGQLLQFPPPALSLRWYRAFFSDPAWTGALWTSLELAVMVTVLSTIVGTLAAFGLTRSSSRLRSILTLVILVPITLPGVVVGVVAYLCLLKLGLLGTMSGIVLAHSVGSICLVVVIVSATLAGFDRRLEQAAMSMRAGPMQTFTRVTIPLIRPGIIAGAVFAFIHSFDEVVVTSLINRFSIYTLPLKMYENISNEIDPTIAAVGSLLTLLPVLWLLALYPTWWKSKRIARQGTAQAPT